MPAANNSLILPPFSLQLQACGKNALLLQLLKCSWGKAPASALPNIASFLPSPLARLSSSGAEGVLLLPQGGGLHGMQAFTGLSDMGGMQGLTGMEMQGGMQPGMQATILNPSTLLASQLPVGQQQVCQKRAECIWPISVTAQYEFQDMHCVRTELSVHIQTSRHSCQHDCHVQLRCLQVGFNCHDHWLRQALCNAAVIADAAEYAARGSDGWRHAWLDRPDARYVPSRHRSRPTPAGSSCCSSHGSSKGWPKQYARDGFGLSHGQQYTCVCARRTSGHEHCSSRRRRRGHGSRLQPAVASIARAASRTITGRRVLWHTLSIAVCGYVTRDRIQSSGVDHASIAV